MKLTHGLAAAALSLTALAANAEITGTVSAVSDYNFRGISLSSKDPALQGSLDYASESGFYAGAWGSTIDYGDGYDGNVEVDLYAGFAGEFAEDFGYDVGLVLYTYPDSSGDSFDQTSEIHTYPEIYAGLAWKWFEVKQWYTNDYSGTDLDAFYTEGNATFELPANFGLTAHLGYSYGDAFDAPVEADPLDQLADSDYLDYSIGVTYTWSHVDFGLSYVDTTLEDGDYLFSSDDAFNSEGRVILSVSTTFPWSAE